MALLFVTGNEHKFDEVSRILEDYSIELEREDFEFRELESESLEDIAADKAVQAFHTFKVPVIVEDTGLFLDEYKAFPSTHAKWLFNQIGFEGIFKLLSGKKRTGHFQTVLCYADREGIHSFSNTMEGKFTKSAIKPNAKVMPYDKIFIPAGKKKPIVELTVEEKNGISMRGKAAREFGAWYNEKAQDDLLDTIDY